MLFNYKGTIIYQDKQKNESFFFLDYDAYSNTLFTLL